MGSRSALISNEDWWSVYLSLFLVLLAVVAFFSGIPLDFVRSALPPIWPREAHLHGIIGSWWAYLGLYLLLAALTSVATMALGVRLRQFLPAFTVLFAGAFLVLLLGSFRPLKLYGLEYPFWALVVGLIIGNFIPLPKWFEVASKRTELYIKMGIVLLGASLPFTVVLRGGLWGLIEALIIISVGFTVAFTIARALGFDKRFAAVLGAGSSVCGVSAAIAVGSSVRADDKQVGYVVSLVVLYALVLIFVIPLAGRALRLGEIVIGAWIGGSELADAAGLAAAAMVGERAVSAFSLVKLNRDVMIGLLAFLFAVLSATRWERGRGEGRPRVGVIWERFPKFVLAFLLASGIATVLAASYGRASIDGHLIGPLSAVRTWLFTLAFLGIGLSTRIGDIRALGPKPIIAFTVVVVVNLVLGLILASLFFGGILARPLG